MNELIAFDLEISKPIIDGVEWKEQRPLGISCASTLTSKGEMRYWHNNQDLVEAGSDSGKAFGDCMTPYEVQKLVGYLLNFINHAGQVVTWNGLGFDFDILAEECQSRTWANRVVKIAMSDHHIDPGFQMVCRLGYMIGLEKCAKGLRVSGKTEGMHGDLAPLLWSGDLSTVSDEQLESIAGFFDGGNPDDFAGSRAAQDLCLEYVGQDSRATMNVYNALVEKREVWWITAKGTICRKPWRPIIKQDPPRLLTVEEALEIDVPNTSWMTDPRPRGVYFEWAEVLKRRQITL